MTQAADELRAKAKAMLQPIPGDSPGGENTQYDARAETLRAEVAKLDALSGGEVDWNVVVRGASTLLTETTKDMLLASYFAYGSMQLDGLGGLATGCALIQGLLTDFWEPLFPPRKRMRARTNAMSWLVSRLEIALPQVSIAPADRPALDALIEIFAELSATTRETMGDAAPAMTPISQALQRMDMKIPKAEKASATPSSTTPDHGPTENAPTENAPTEERSEHAAPASAPPSPPTAKVAAPDAKAREAAATWLEPISADAPTGTDARYAPEYEAMRAEVAKLESPTGEEVDWLEVAANAGTIIKTKSKDVLAAAYLAFAQWENDGVVGLGTGIAIVLGLFETFPAKRWPKRERGQGNALGWLMAQLQRVLDPYQAQPADRVPLQAAEILLKAASTAVRDQLEDHAPSFRPMQDRVQRLLLSVPEPKKEPAAPPPNVTPQAAEPTPTAQAPAAPPVRAAPAPSVGTMPATADVGDIEEVSKFLRQTGQAMVKAAGLLRTAQVAAPAAYRLVRTGLFLHINAAPPSDAAGKTTIPPLPAARRQQYDLLASNQKWAALIEETESALGQFRFTLDLHRLTGQALAGLGHEDALTAMVAELGATLRRMPSWPDLSAADGSPFADDATRAWLAETVATQPGAGGDGGGAPDDGADPETMAKARALLSGGKAADGLKLAHASVREATQPRHRFTRRLDLAEMCLGGGQAHLARGVFASLHSEIAGLGLEEWEPDLAARCLAGLVKAIRASTKKGTPPDPAERAAFEQLCHLDPPAAARLAPAS